MRKEVLLKKLLENKATKLKKKVSYFKPIK